MWVNCRNKDIFKYLLLRHIKTSEIYFRKFQKIIKAKLHFMARDNWTREQTIVALNLYCKIPFNRVSSNHPDIIRIAKIIDRSPNSVKMKI